MYTHIVCLTQCTYSIEMTECEFIYTIRLSNNCTFHQLLYNYTILMSKTILNRYNVLEYIYQLTRRTMMTYILL